MKDEPEDLGVLASEQRRVRRLLEAAAAKEEPDPAAFRRLAARDLVLEVRLAGAGSPLSSLKGARDLAGVWGQAAELLSWKATDDEGEDDGFDFGAPPKGVGFVEGTPVHGPAGWGSVPGGRVEARDRRERSGVSYRACSPGTVRRVVELLREGLSLRNAAKLGNVSLKTAQNYKRKYLLNGESLPAEDG